MNQQQKILKIESKIFLNFLLNPKNIMDGEMKNMLNVFGEIILCNSGNDIHLGYTDLVCALENTTESYIVSFQTDVNCSVFVMMKQIVQEVLLENDLKDRIAAILINFKLH